MIWYFTREHAHVDLEVHRLPGGTGYLFAVTQADGSEKVEQYTDAARLVTRVLTVQQRLLDDGWMPASPGGGQRPVVRPPVRARRARYAGRARQVISRLHRSVTRRLAAAFGL